MTGELNNAQNSTVIKRKKIDQILKIHKQYQSKQCLMDIQSNLTVYNKLGLLCKKQEWINSF